jgi:hypothetical protein
MLMSPVGLCSGKDWGGETLQLLQPTDLISHQREHPTSTCLQPSKDNFKKEENFGMATKWVGTVEEPGGIRMSSIGNHNTATAMED